MANTDAGFGSFFSLIFALWGDSFQEHTREEFNKSKKLVKGFL